MWRVFQPLVSWVCYNERVLTLRECDIWWNVPKTNSSPQKIDGWKMKFPLEVACLQWFMLVSARVYTLWKIKMEPENPLFQKGNISFKPSFLLGSMLFSRVYLYIYICWYEYIYISIYIYTNKYNMYIISFFIRSCGPIHHWIQETRGTKVRSADMPFPHGKLNEPLWISGNSDSGFLWCFMYTYMVNVQGQAVRFRKGIGCAPQDCGDHRHCYMSNRGFQVQAKPSFTTLTGRPPHPNNIHTHTGCCSRNRCNSGMYYGFLFGMLLSRRLESGSSVNTPLISVDMLICSVSLWWVVVSQYKYIEVSRQGMLCHISSFTVSKLAHILKSRGEKE